MSFMKPSKKELIDMLDEMRLSLERLPGNAMCESISNYDLQSLLLLLSAIFRADADPPPDCKEDS